MFRRNQGSRVTPNTKVGVLFNVPAKPSRGENIDFVAEAGVQEEAEAVQEALGKLRFEYHVFPLGDDVESLIKALKSHKPDVVINLCEGAFGDSHQEMNVPSLLELLGIPYTGSSPSTLGVCQNKGLTKDILKANGVRTPEYRVLDRFEDWKGEIDYPLFVKPLQEDASIGISKKSYVTNSLGLKAQVEYINKQYKQPALVEKYIAGRELNVAILGNEKPKALPISEILFAFQEEPKIVGYAAKWFAESEEYVKTKPTCPADLNPSIRRKVVRAALLAYRALHCRDYARVDVRLRDDLPFVLEVNPNPDISPEAGFTRSLKAAGIPYEQFIREIIFYALRRGARPKP